MFIIGATAGASMPDFADLIPASHQHVSAGFLETLIQARREELFTGLMRLGDSGGEHHIQSFLEGTQQTLYRCAEGVVEVLPKHTWQDAFSHNNATVGFLPFPIEAMRFIRVLHEAPVRHIDESTLTLEQLTEAAGKWAAEKEPGIVHVEGDKINRYYLIAGQSIPVVEELSVLGGEARLSLSDASFPKMLPRREYHVLRYVSDRDHELWHEYELRHAFSPFMRMLLGRFSELAGRVLTERLCERISVWAREGGWNVTLNSNGFVNRQYFDTLESAIGLYVDLLSRFQDEASPAIGSRMADGISQEVLIKLDSDRRELLTKNILSRQGVGSVAGMGWR